MKLKLTSSDVPVRAGLILLFFLASFSGLVVAATPVVTNVTLRGLQIDQPTTIKLNGTALAHNPRLYAPIRFEQTVLESDDSAFTVEVHVDAEVSSNIYPFRIVTDAGISKPFLMSVDRLSQTQLSPEPKCLPVAMTGDLTGQQIHRVEIEAQKGDTITIDVEGRRLGSSLRPVLRIYDSENRQVGWAKPSRLINGDARMDFTSPESGRYRVELHDLVYKGPGSGFFRLKIGAFSTPKFPYPLATSHALEPIPYWTRYATLSDAVDRDASSPAVFRSSCVELTEEAFANGSNVPFGVTGRLANKGEVDAYEFTVTPETTIHCRVWSHQLGTPLDSQLVIEDTDGKQLGAGDDHDKTLDPMVVVKIPADVTQVRAKISSLAGMHGDECVYRLEVSDSIPSDVDVDADSAEVAIPAGRQVILPFRIDRKGSKEPIRIQANGESVLRFDSFVAQEHDNRCLVEISAPSYTRAIVPLRFVAASGRANGIAEFVRLPSENPNVQFPENIDCVAAVIEESPVSVGWMCDSNEAMFRGGRFAGQVSVSKPAEQTVRLSLISTQSPPDEKEKQAKEIRLENINGEGNDYTFEIVIPDGYPMPSPAHEWGYAIRADLLSMDEKSVSDSAFTRLRRSVIHEPIELAVASPAKQQFKIGEKDQVNIKGTISRLPQIEYAVNVQLQGVPEDSGVKASTARIDSQQGEFELTVDLSGATKPVNLDKLSLEAKFDTDAAMVKDVRRSVGLQIQLTAADEKPSE